jgi:exonuclease VII large subunit
MRHTASIILLIFAAASASGCLFTQDKEAAVEEELGLAATRLDRVKSESKEAVQATRDYANQERIEFVDKMKRDLHEMDKELQRLVAKVDSAKGQAKADAKVKFADAREKWAQAKQGLEKAESAGDDNWEEVKASSEKAYVDLEDAVDQARTWLSEKIEP